MSLNRYSRQSFLGDLSQNIIENAVVGIIGLGGGGAHIIQQLAHIGFLNFVIIDPQKIEMSNINRMVGSTLKDVEDEVLKTEISKKMIRGLQPNAQIDAFSLKWQENAEALKKCDIIFGCVDGYSERDQLEIFCRRNLIPYFDIGMDVHIIENESPRMVGQVILSLPDGPCMRCLGFIDEEKLKIEAGKYGDAGSNPQVVWSNGVLASSAVGMAINILTGWSYYHDLPIYLSYDGNTGLLTIHPKIKYGNFEGCNHFPGDQISMSTFKEI